MRAHRHTPGGFMLVELLVALAISVIVVAGVLNLARAATGGYRLQQNLAAMQENARFALQMIGRDAEHAGYHPEPWLENGLFPAISAESSDDSTAAGDVIAFTRRSPRNCYANDNPITDETGAPLSYLLESVYRVTDSGGLARTCRYGPDAASLTTQVNNLGLVQGVEALQAIYAEDTDADGNADRWVNAGGWASERGVVGIRISILLAGPDRLDADTPANLLVLSETVATPDDGRLRRVYTTARAIMGRSG